MSAGDDWPRARRRVFPPQSRAPIGQPVAPTFDLDALGPVDLRGRPGPDRPGPPDSDRASRIRRRWLLSATILLGSAMAVLTPLVLVEPGAPTGAPVPTTSGLTASDGHSASSTFSPGPPSPSRSPRPSMAPLTLQAEAGQVSGSAQVDAYPGASGGRIVRDIGRWGPGRPGALRFSRVTVPADGTYVLTFFFLNTDGEAKRTAVVTVGAEHAVSVTVTGSAVCCGSARLTVHLQAGENTITFGNRDGRAPSIDRILISTG
jgi:hypothetical protein